MVGFYETVHLSIVCCVVEAVSCFLSCFKIGDSIWISGFTAKPVGACLTTYCWLKPGLHSGISLVAGEIFLCENQKN